MSSAFIQAAVILLREGLEAMLVIAALAGYLTKAGAGHRVRALYGGSLAAVGASIIAAWLFAVLNSGQHSDVLEGIIILVAASLMLYVSGWLMVKQDPRGWQDYLAHKAKNALAQDTVWAVAALAFLAVFREGAETVLFINALASAEGGWSLGLFAGLAAPTAGLVVLFYFINLIAQKLPLRPAAVHHHIGVLVCDGAQIYRRSRAGVPGAVDAAVHRTYKRRMAPRHRIESEHASAVGAVAGDRVGARDLFSASAQQPARPRRQSGDARREAVKSLAITVNAAGVGQAVPIVDVVTAVVGA